MPPDEDDPAPLQSLIALWDMHADRPWKVAGVRSAINIAMINAYVSHTVNLGRAVLLLHNKQMHFEQIPLVRSSMESAVTAAWLAVFPEKTPDLARHSSAERRKVIQELLEHGSVIDGAEARLDEIDEFLSDYEGPPLAEGRYLKSRFAALAGGKHLYTMYRTLCAWDHATSSLADAYTGTTEATGRNPWGLVLHGRANGWNSWVGWQAALVLRAQIAADMALEKPRHRTQLSRLARRMEVTDTIEAAADPAS